MKYLESSSEVKAAMAQPRAVAALYYADWCPFSVMSRVSFEAVESRFSKFEFAKVRLDELDPAEQRLLPSEIEEIPTLIISYSGAILSRIVGYFPSSTLAEKLEGIEKSILVEASGAGRASRPAYRGRAHLLSVELPEDINRYRARSRVTIPHASRGLSRAAFDLDRTLTQIVLFFFFAQKQGAPKDLFLEGQLTDRGRLVLQEMKARISVPPGGLHVLENSGSRDKMYLPKQISRLNRIFRSHTGTILIENIQGSYRVSDQFEIEIKGMR
jgi:hypothetical protein